MPRREWLPDYVSWYLVIDGDHHAALWGRELCAYVTGKVDIVQYAGGRRAEAALDAFEEDFPNVQLDAGSYKEEPRPDDIDLLPNPFETLIDYRPVDPDDVGTWHRSPYDYAPTPGRTNLGDGTCVDVTPEQPLVHPAYESVVIFLQRAPTQSELDLLLPRIQRFANARVITAFDAPPVIRDVRIVSERVLLQSESFPK